MFKDKPNLFFSVGVYTATSIIAILLLIATYVLGSTLGTSIESFADVLGILLGFLSLLTIPALFILAIVHGTIPKKLMDSFYDLCLNRNKLFLYGAMIPITMSVVFATVYGLFMVIPQALRSYYVLVFVEIFISFWISPLLVKLYVSLNRK